MRYAISLLPVLVFLATLVLLDSFRLVRPRAICAAIMAGAAAALVAYFLHPVLGGLFTAPATTYSCFIGPVVEESLKASYVVFLIQTRRVGFMVDAAICGFAVGAGFAIVENLFYLRIVEPGAPVVWVLRGCGTAAMHSAATALFAILASRSSIAGRPLNAISVLSGLLLAAALHVLYNRFLVSPLLATALMVVATPLILATVFWRSEQRLRHWLDLGFDTDAEFLRMLSSGNLSSSRAGQYLHSLKAVLPAETVVDMFCLLRIQVELSLQAKGTLMMRRAGFSVPVPTETTERIEELKHLKCSIGRAGWLTLRPLLGGDRRDRWQLTVLRGG